MNETIPTYYEPPSRESENMLRALSKRKQFEDIILQNESKLERALKEKLDEDDFARVYSVGQFLLTGMSFEESLTLTFTTEEHMEFLKMKAEEVGVYIEFCQMVYKAELTRTLTGAAVSGESKIAGWLMERKYAEYSAKSKDDLSKGARDHVLDEAMEYVLENGDDTPLISEKGHE